MSKRANNLRVYVYEYQYGNRGIIIASSYEMAKQILKKEIDLEPTDDKGDYEEGRPYLYSVCDAKEGEMTELEFMALSY